MAGEQEETVKAQVCKDMGCEDWHDARGCDATTPNFPDLSPAVLKWTWRDTQHASSFAGAASFLLPSLTPALYSEAASEWVWTLVLETPVWEVGRGWGSRGGEWAASEGEAPGLQKAGRC